MQLASTDCCHNSLTLKVPIGCPSGQSPKVGDLVLCGNDDVMYIADIGGFSDDAEEPEAILVNTGLNLGGSTGPQGNSGKSAYEYAQDGGYTGTEEDFAGDMGAIGTGCAYYVTLTETDGSYTADKTYTEIEAAYQNGDVIVCQVTYNNNNYLLPLKNRVDLFTWQFSAVVDSLEITATIFVNMIYVKIGSVGAQADLDENDSSEASYVKGRTHYDAREKTGTVVNYSVDELGSTIDLGLTLTVGQAYTVFFNGAYYSCTAEEYTSDIIILGNGAPLGLAGNAEPFYLMQAVDSGETIQFIVVLDGSESIQFSISKGEIKHLDNKFLDLEWYADSKEVVLAEGDVTFASAGSGDDTYGAGSTTMDALGLAYSDLEVGKTYIVYIGDSKFMMSCAYSEDEADGESCKVLTEVYSGITNASVAIYNVNSGTLSNMYIWKPSSTEGTFNVRFCKKEVDRLPEEYLPESVSGIIIRSSSTDSKKRFLLTVDDNGTVGTTEIT